MRTATTLQTTPAGDTIEVWSDDDVMSAIGFEPSGIEDFIVRRTYANTLQLGRERLAVVRALWRDGTFTDKSGLATKRLAESCGLATTSTGNVFQSPIMQFAAEREIRGKRCYSIRLCAIPQRWLSRLDVEEAASPAEPLPTEAEVVPPGPVPMTDSPSVEVPGSGNELERTTESASPGLAATGEAAPQPRAGLDSEPPAYDPPTLEVAHAVATSLLTQVVEIIVAGHGNGHDVERLRTDLDTVAGRLAAQLEETSRLRRNLREAGDELSAVKFERDGLRKRLAAAEYNLKVASASVDVNRIVDAEVRKKLGQMMSEVPHTGVRAAG